MALGNFSNLAEGTLASAINAAATSATLTTGQGAYFPASNFFAILWDKSQGDPATAYRAGKAEVVLCSSRSTDVLTITRAQQSSSAVDFTGLTVGVIHDGTKADWDAIVTQLALKSPLASPTFTGNVLMPDGTVGSPGWAFSSDSDNGARYIGLNNWSLVAGGADFMAIIGAGSTSGLSFTVGANSASSGTPALFSLSATVNETSTAGYTALKVSVVETATGNGTKRLLDLLAGSAGTTSKFSVDSAGVITASGQFNGAQISGTFVASSGVSRAGQYFEVSGHSIWSSPTDGKIILQNNAATGFTTLQFGGTTSSFPAVKVNGANLEIKLADDSAYTGLKAGNITQDTAKIFSVTSGTNQRAGNATLVAGTVTVLNTTVTANTIVMLTRKTSGGTIGTAITYTVSAGTNFVISSDNILDTSTFSYFLIEVP